MNTVTVKTQVIGVLQSLNANPKQTLEMLDRLWRFTKIYENVPTFYLFTIGDKLDFCWGWGNDNQYYQDPLSAIGVVINNLAPSRVYMVEGLAFQENNLMAKFSTIR